MQWAQSFPPKGPSFIREILQIKCTNKMPLGKQIIWEKLLQARIKLHNLLRKLKCHFIKAKKKKKSNKKKKKEGISWQILLGIQLKDTLLVIFFYQKHVGKPTANEKTDFSYVVFILVFKGSSSKYSTNKIFPSQGGDVMDHLYKDRWWIFQTSIIFLRVILLFGASIEGWTQSFKLIPCEYQAT